MNLLSMQYVEVMKSAGLSLSMIALIMNDTIKHTDANRINALNILKNKLEELQQKILYYQEVELLMTRIIQSLEVMTCPTDMEQVEDIIKELYAQLVETKEQGGRE